MLRDHVTQPAETAAPDRLAFSHVQTFKVHGTKRDRLWVGIPGSRPHHCGRWGWDRAFSAPQARLVKQLFLGKASEAEETA